MLYYPEEKEGGEARSPIGENATEPRNMHGGG